MNNIFNSNPEKLDIFIWHSGSAGTTSATRFHPITLYKLHHIASNFTWKNRWRSTSSWNACPRTKASTLWIIIYQLRSQFTCHWSGALIYLHNNILAFGLVLWLRAHSLLHAPIISLSHHPQKRKTQWSRSCRVIRWRRSGLATMRPRSVNCCDFIDQTV